MKQLLATLALIGVIVQAGVVYPQTLKVTDVEKIDGGYILMLCSGDRKMYDTVTEWNGVRPGELMAALMYDNMTTGNTTDDTIIAIRRTGFFEKEGG